MNDADNNEQIGTFAQGTDYSVQTADSSAQTVDPAVISADSSAHKDVRAVNIVFLILAVVPQLISMTGLFVLVESYAMKLLVSQLMFVLPVIVYLLVFKKSAAVCRFRRIRISNLLLCLLFYICIMPVMTFLNTVSLLYSKNGITSVILGVSSEIPFAAGLLIVAVIPAFCEELTYRGVIFNTYRQVNPLGAIILSGVLFGLLHGNLNQITYAIALGIAFALLVEATDSIFSSMVVHCLVNSFSTVVIYAIPKLLDYIKVLRDEAEAAGDTRTLELIRTLIGTREPTVDAFFGVSMEMGITDVLRSIAGALIPAAIGGALAFFLYRLIARRCGRWEHIQNIFRNRQKSGRLITAPLVIAMLALVAVTVLNELVLRGIIAL